MGSGRTATSWVPSWCPETQAWWPLDWNSLPSGQGEDQTLDSGGIFKSTCQTRDKMTWNHTHSLSLSQCGFPGFDTVLLLHGCNYGGHWPEATPDLPRHCNFLSIKDYFKIKSVFFQSSCRELSVIVFPCLAIGSSCDTELPGRRGRAPTKPWRCLPKSLQVRASPGGSLLSLQFAEMSRGRALAPPYKQERL